MRRVEEVLARLTPEQQQALTVGRDLWSVAGIPDLGIPDVVLTDGPNGARGSGLLGAGRVSALCVPCGLALGATWDPDLVRRVGQALGEEARTKGARVLLAPTVNLVRDPRAGRTFECWGEDPLHTGVLATAFVEGVQSRGVAATVKHFVGNEAEHQRTTVDSRIDERSLREIYLVPFELALREAWAVMTAYNRVNGSWVTESGPLMGWLRERFDGLAMTDWFGVGSAEALVDLQMPGPARWQMTDDLETKARRWLTLIDRTGAWDDQPVEEQAVETDEHRALARQACAESTVLLRNDGLLPLTGTEKVALIGLDGALMGGGSAQLRPHRQPTIAEALAERLDVTVVPGPPIDKLAPPLRGPWHVTFDDGTTAVEPTGRLLWFGLQAKGFRATTTFAPQHDGAHQLALSQCGCARLIVGGTVVVDGTVDPPATGTGLFGLGSSELLTTVDLTAGREVEVVVEWSAEGSFVLHGAVVGHRPPTTVDLLAQAEKAAAAADVAIVVVGTSAEHETEGEDRTTLRLPGDQDELVRRVVAANPRTVVVVNAGTAVLMDWEPAAVVVPWLGGQEMPYALADVLLGDTDPAGRLPVTVPLRDEHLPAYGAFPGENDQVTYGEGLLVGYRWYTTRWLPVRHPFGAGQSYTTFAWSDPRLDGDEVVVTVTNTGSRRGAEVVQLYVEPPAGRLFRPCRELKGFAKAWLDPGASTTVRIPLPDRAFAAWDPGSPDHDALQARLGDATVVPVGPAPTPREPGWWVEAGEYRLVLGTDAETVVHALTTTREEQRLTDG